MDTNDEPGPGWVLAMPFVTTASHGGPHEDDAYCAGWQMGALDQRCGASRHFGLGGFCTWVLAVNLPQADLIAMRHGMVIERQPSDSDTWVHLHLVPGS